MVETPLSVAPSGHASEAEAVSCAFIVLCIFLNTSLVLVSLVFGRKVEQRKEAFGVALFVSLFVPFDTSRGDQSLHCLPFARRGRRRATPACGIGGGGG